MIFVDCICLRQWRQLVAPHAAMPEVSPSGASEPFIEREDVSHSAFHWRKAAVEIGSVCSGH
jgi:hypothetical protein